VLQFCIAIIFKTNEHTAHAALLYQTAVAGKQALTVMHMHMGS